MRSWEGLTDLTGQGKCFPHAGYDRTHVCVGVTVAQRCTVPFHPKWRLNNPIQRQKGLYTHGYPETSAALPHKPNTDIWEKRDLSCGQDISKWPYVILLQTQPMSDRFTTLEPQMSTAVRPMENDAVLKNQSLRIVRLWKIQQQQKYLHTPVDFK